MIKSILLILLFITHVTAVASSSSSSSSSSLATSLDTASLIAQNVSEIELTAKIESGDICTVESDDMRLTIDCLELHKSTGVLITKGRLCDTRGLRVAASELGSLQLHYKGHLFGRIITDPKKIEKWMLMVPAEHWKTSFFCKAFLSTIAWNLNIGIDLSKAEDYLKQNSATPSQD